MPSTPTATIRLTAGQSSTLGGNLTEAMGQVRMTVGSDPSCTWQIAADGVAALHFEIYWNTRELWIGAGETAPVWVNNAPLTGWQPIAGNARISFGKAALSVELATEGVAPEVAGASLASQGTAPVSMPATHDAVTSETPSVEAVPGVHVSQTVETSLSYDDAIEQDTNPMQRAAPVASQAETVIVALPPEEMHGVSTHADAGEALEALSGDRTRVEPVPSGFIEAGESASESTATLKTAALSGEGAASALSADLSRAAGLGERFVLPPEEADVPWQEKLLGWFRRSPGPQEASPAPHDAREALVARVSEWVRKNRMLAAAAAATMVLLLGAGVWLSVRPSRRAAHGTERPVSPTPPTGVAHTSGDSVLKTPPADAALELPAVEVPVDPNVTPSSATALVVAGRLTEAAAAYDSLAKRFSDQPAYEAAARVLHRKAQAACPPGEPCEPR